MNSTDPSMQLKNVIESASQIISPTLSLKTFIARNPLQGLEHIPFTQALSVGASIFSKNDQQDVNRQMIKWCQAFYDQGQAAIPMPDKEKGFYNAWLSLAKYDKHLKHKLPFLKSLSQNPEAGIRRCLEELRVKEKQWEAYLSHTLAQLPGWAAYIKGKGQLIDYLAVRLATTAILVKDRPPNYSKADTKKQPLFNQIKVQEKKYHDQLMKALARPIKNPRKNGRPDAQLVFCIDIRSEPIRRRIERLGNYETLGCAGFFGLPIQLHHHNEVIPSCPIIVKPQHTVFVSAEKKQHSPLSTLYKNLKFQFGTAFALVETIGSCFGLAMFWKMIAPRAVKLWHSGMKRLSHLLPKNDKKYSFLTPFKAVDKKAYDLSQIPFEKKVLYAENLLRGMGLTSNFSRWVVFFGHGSSTTNNPFASSLDCGACGGNHGDSNAQIAAEILNSPDIRKRLSEHRIEIPDDTTFVGALHNTTTDYFHFLDLFEEDEAFENLKKCLLRIGRENAQFRLDGSPFSIGVKRSMDWSEVRPELGLAKNASFIAAKRAFTYGINLEGRTFLHSYDWEQDEDGTILEGILTGPLMVAFRINSQYFFSTFDSSRYGAGDKIMHNVMGKIGIVHGNASDLMLGLPVQSVFSSDDSPLHEPIRLLTIVNAPAERVEKIIDKHHQLFNLIHNEWIFLKVFDPNTQTFQAMKLPN